MDIELYIKILIQEQKINEVLDFLGVSKNIDKLIASEVLSKNYCYQHNIIKVLIKNIIEYLFDNLSINMISLLKETNKNAKNFIKKETFKFIDNVLKELGYKKYNGVYFISDFNQEYGYIKSIISKFFDVISLNYNTNYINLAYNNIKNVLLNNKKYIFLKHIENNNNQYLIYMPIYHYRTYY